MVRLFWNTESDNLNRCLMTSLTALISDLIGGMAVRSQRWRINIRDACSVLSFITILGVSGGRGTSSVFNNLTNTVNSTQLVV